MAIQTINIGTSANKGDGDPLRTAFKKINENFAELNPLTGAKLRDINGSVFADDSTLLVDAVNGTITAAVLVGTLPALNGSNLTNLTIPAQTFASLTGTPTTLAGYGIADAYTQTQVNTAITNATSSIVIPTGSTQSIDVVADDSTLLVDSANGTLNATTLTGALPAIDGSSLTGITITEEAFDTLTGSTGVVAHDCDNGHVFYHTGASGDITANFTNLGLTAENATNLTVIINQGATPYEVTAVQIGGAAQTIEWQGGSQPTGNANGIDSFSFTILNDGGSYVVLGQMVDFT